MRSILATHPRSMVFFIMAVVAMILIVPNNGFLINNVERCSRQANTYVSLQYEGHSPRGCHGSTSAMHSFIFPRYETLTRTKMAGRDNNNNNNNNENNDGQEVVTAASDQAILGGSGTAAALITLYSEYTLKSTGCGLPAGPFGLVGAVEGISYLSVVAIAAWSAYTKLKTGKGLPSGPAGLLGAAEGLAYLALLVGIVVLVFQVTDYGYIPNAVPMEGGMCS